MPWCDALGFTPWPLLPVAGRPLISYWFELCTDLGLCEVQILVGEGGERIESYCGAGEAWGLSIRYCLMRDEENPASYLQRDPSRWEQGLFFIGGAVFPLRTRHFVEGSLATLKASGCRITSSGLLEVLLCAAGEFGNMAEIDPPSGASGLEFIRLESLNQYYRVNMDLLRGGIQRYVSGGYSATDGSFIGRNVVTPPSVSLTPPLVIGNDCRIGALSSVGPHTVIADHVLIDQQCDVRESIILPNTYIGRNLEISGKIVCGGRIADPEDGTCMEIEDSWLVASTRSARNAKDAVRGAAGWILSLLLLLIQAIPFSVLYGLIRLRREGRLVRKTCYCTRSMRKNLLLFEASASSSSRLLSCFRRGALDRVPLLIEVLRGRLWLCGQVPLDVLNDPSPPDPEHYFPGVYRLTDVFPDIDPAMDARHYAHTRSIRSDLRILAIVLMRGAGGRP